MKMYFLKYFILTIVVFSNTCDIDKRKESITEGTGLELKISYISNRVPWVTPKMFDTMY